MESKTNGKTFKERYTEDEDFKAKHNAYIKEKVECDCGKMVMRVAMAKHKRTAIHQKLINAKAKHDAPANEEIEEMVDRMVKLKLRELLKLDNE